jgi:hypothetical protein
MTTAQEKALDVRVGQQLRRWLVQHQLAGLQRNGVV